MILQLVVLRNEELVTLFAETFHADAFLKFRSSIFMQINQVITIEESRIISNINLPSV